MAEELKVVLKRSEDSSFGFSLLGTSGLPHVIYDIMENSPAAECGVVEAGDVIVKVNGTDVHRFTTKEVLKCLRLSQDPVTLELKRDPKIKAHVQNYLDQNSHSYSDSDSQSASPRLSPTSQLSARPHGACHRITSSDPQCRPSRIPTIIRSPVHTSSKSCPQSPHGQNKSKLSQIPTVNGSNNKLNSINTNSTNNGNAFGSNEPLAKKKSGFEAYMMTGDLILNLSRTQQSSELITTHSKKIDSLRDSTKKSSRRNGAVAPHAKGESSPSSPSYSDSSNSVNSIKRSLDKDKDYNEPNTKKQLNNNESDGYVINKNDIESGSGVNSSYASANNKYSEQELIGCASSTSSSNSYMYNKQRQMTTNNIDSVDCAKHNKLNSTTDKYQSFTSSDMVTTSKAQQQQQQTTASSTAATAATSTTSRQTITNAAVYEQHNYHHSKVTSSSSSSTIKSESSSSPDACFSVPTSPTSLSTPNIEALSSYKQKDISNSAPTSPESAAQDMISRRTHHHHHHHHQQQQQQQNGVMRKCDVSGFRTSRSEDHLQHTQRDTLGAIVPIDIDEDVNSSLNTLLDTRHDSEDSQSTSDRDRIVWTYNAPVVPTTTSSYNNSHSFSSSISSSPQHTDSPASPTSVSSSIMSSNSGSKGATNNQIGALNSLTCPMNGTDLSASEAVSNISSPDYQDDDNLLSSKDIAGIVISDPSDSDSTILVSDANAKQRQQQALIHQQHYPNQLRDEFIATHHRDGQYQQHSAAIKPVGLKIQPQATLMHVNVIVNSPNAGGNHSQHHQPQQHQLQLNDNGFENQGHGAELQNSQDELATIAEDPPPTVVINSDGMREASPPVSDDGSDVDSLHSYHYSPKAVDIPSAVRLAKRLYGLEGFKKSDVSRHLSKNNDFSRAVAEEYLRYFDFDGLKLDEALRLFLQQFSLSGETQERERVLVHFSKRYLDCNPGSFNSQDAVHTLTCAIMLLNTDLHGQNIGRKMTCSEFIDNLAELNDGENFPKDVLKYLYQAIKEHPLEWALDDDYNEQKIRGENSIQVQQIGSNPFLETPPNAAAIEYKKGYVMRKCCYDANNKKTPFGKRSWKMFYCTLRDLVLYLHKDEHGFRKSQVSDNVHNAIRIYHALATKATDYTKKQHVFRLQTADQAEYLFQTSDSKELQSWIDTINFVCAAFSAPPLEGGVGSQKRFQRPLLPSSHTKLLLREQLASHENKVLQLEESLAEHKRCSAPSKGLPLQNYVEKEAYLQYELKRYKTYGIVLTSRMLAEQQSDYQNCLVTDETVSQGYQQLTVSLAGANKLSQSQIPLNSQQQLQQHPQPTNRYSYRAAIYRSEAQQDIG